MTSGSNFRGSTDNRGLVPASDLCPLAPSLEGVVSPSGPLPSGDLLEGAKSTQIYPLDDRAFK